MFSISRQNRDKKNAIFTYHDKKEQTKVENEKGNKSIIKTYDDLVYLITENIKIVLMCVEKTVLVALLLYFFVIMKK